MIAKIFLLVCGSTMALFAVGCEIGNTGVFVPPVVDAAPPDAFVMTFPCEDRETPPVHPRDEEHELNTGCMDSGCHNAGGQGGEFQVGGTVYRGAIAPADNLGIGGIVVRVIDSQGNNVKMVSTDNGAFWYEKGGSNINLVPPYTTYVTACDEVMEMESPATGDCGRGGCHTNATAPSVGMVWINKPRL